LPNYPEDKSRMRVISGVLVIVNDLLTVSK